MIAGEAVDAAERRKAALAEKLVARADLRIQVVQREVNHVLGLGREHVAIAEFGAALIVAALDSFDDSRAAQDMSRLEDDELRLLRRFWNQYWNRTGHCDPGDGGENALITWAEVTALDELAGAVEDHYIEHGFPEGTYD